MSELKQQKDQNLLFPVKIGLQNYFVNKEIVREAIAMRDRVSADFAAIYLQFKGISMDVALTILAMPTQHVMLAQNAEKNLSCL
jgi:hypothetical protein